MCRYFEGGKQSRYVSIDTSIPFPPASVCFNPFSVCRALTACSKEQHSRAANSTPLPGLSTPLPKDEARTRPRQLFVPHVDFLRISHSPVAPYPRFSTARAAPSSPTELIPHSCAFWGGFKVPFCLSRHRSPKSPSGRPQPCFRLSTPAASQIFIFLREKAGGEGYQQERKIAPLR